MRVHLVAAAAMFLACVPAGPSRAQAPIVLKFNHVVAPETPKGKAALKFQELAAKFTNNRVKVEVYPGGTLYKDDQELEALQRGDVQMAAPTSANLSMFGLEQFDIFDLPF